METRRLGNPWEINFRLYFFAREFLHILIFLCVCVCALMYSDHEVTRGVYAGSFDTLPPEDPGSVLTVFVLQVCGIQFHLGFGYRDDGGYRIDGKSV